VTLVSTSSTVIAALKYEGGVLIAADSQASDPLGEVRWPIEKLDRVGSCPIVLGFSGSVGICERARSATNGIQFHGNQFKKRDHIRDALARAIDPFQLEVRRKLIDGFHGLPWEIAIWGLGVYWAEDQAHIIEFETSGDDCFHSTFQAIGSGAKTAHAIYRALGGNRLQAVGYEKAVMALLRILRTSVEVELWGVGLPLRAWVVRREGAKKIASDEIEANLQYVDEWERADVQRFFEG